MDAVDALPSGMVTFVFTDIEGSTRLIRALGDAYVPVLDRHRELLRAAWEAYGGHEVDTEGDSFFVAFGDQSAAIAACVEGQRALGAEVWPTTPVRVRMGIHRGVAFPRGHDYVAFVVHQAARIVNAAHGGQIVISPEAADGVDLPDGVALRSLGRFRVRDFDEPVELWQVTGDGLADDFPALRVLPADRHNLAVPLTPLLGRVTELAHLGLCVEAGRVVTITGLGGIGKTRLAIEHGLLSLERWPGGVWFVDLATLVDGELVPAAVAAALGARATEDAHAVAAVEDRLTGTTALLILDNVEHVREAVARLIADVLGHHRGVGVLATSREPIGLRAETVVRLGPLSIDSDGDRSAVQLFLDRAAESGVTRPASVESVEELCRRLDGLPLAIEMAAARAAVMTPEEILAGLDGEGRGFVSRDPTLAARHRSLDDLLEWSDRLLDPDEAAAVRRLAVFVGAFGYETAAAAAVDPDRGVGGAIVPDLIWSLVNKSLLDVDATAGATRYRFPVTVRTFARRHDPSGEVPRAASRLAQWYVDRLGPTSSLDRGWVAEMADELDNLRGVIAILATESPPAAQQIAWSIGQHHDLVQTYRSGIDEVQRLVDLLDAPTPSRVGLLTLLADLHLRVGAIDRAGQVLDTARSLRDRVGPAPWDESSVERTEGELLMALGDPAAAARLAEDALDGPLGHVAQARMWNLLGIARWSGGDAVGAVPAFERELTCWHRAGREAMVPSAEGNVAEALLSAGDRTGAAQRQRQSLHMALQFGQPVSVAFSMIVAARLAADDGQWATAVRLQTAAESQLTEIGTVLYPPDRAAADALLSAGAEHLGPDAFAAAQHRGRTDDFDTFLTATDEILAAVASTRMETHV